jgi:hypothetical protein
MTDINKLVATALGAALLVFVVLVTALQTVKNDREDPDPAVAADCVTRELNSFFQTGQDSGIECVPEVPTYAKHPVGYALLAALASALLVLVVGRVYIFMRRTEEAGR